LICSFSSNYILQVLHFGYGNEEVNRPSICLTSFMQNKMISKITNLTMKSKKAPAFDTSWSTRTLYFNFYHPLSIPWQKLQDMMTCLKFDVNWLLNQLRSLYLLLSGLLPCISRITEFSERRCTAYIV
jgi:hypothetical protein